MHICFYATNNSVVTVFFDQCIVLSDKRYYKDVLSFTMMLFHVSVAGVPPMKIVEAHGTFLTSSCIRCAQSHPSEVVKVMVILLFWH